MPRNNVARSNVKVAEWNCRCVGGPLDGKMYKATGKKFVYKWVQEIKDTIDGSVIATRALTGMYRRRSQLSVGHRPYVYVWEFEGERE